MATSKLTSGVAAEIPERLVNGLRNYWYPLMLSQNVGTDKPVGTQRLGEDLVVWRGRDGKPRLFADFCPHKGARLSHTTILAASDRDDIVTRLKGRLDGDSQT